MRIIVVQFDRFAYHKPDIIVIFRCNCYGHAEKCDTSVRPYKCACLAESNTVGDKV